VRGGVSFPAAEKPRARGDERRYGLDHLGLGEMSHLPLSG
jgi:hypothetical protein